MKNIVHYFLLLLIPALTCCQPKTQTTAILTATDFVDPLIGTAVATTPSALKHSVSGSELRGQTFPGVGTPHGMTQWTPQTQYSEKKCLPPYYFEDTEIQGFRGSHWMSGSCTQDYGSVTIMPVAGKLITDPLERASGFYRDEEIATPYSYDVILNKYNVAVEMSATSRCGILKFKFNTYNKRPYILIEPNSDEGLGFVHIDVEKNMVYGYNPVHRIYQGWGESAGFSGYFAVQFSEPFTIYGTWKNNDIVYENKEVTGQQDTVGAFVGFEFLEDLTVKVGTSFTGIEDALANLQAEIPGWSIEEIREKTRDTWMHTLSKIEVRGGDSAMRKKFYTALYHAYQLPRIVNDVDGSYPGFAEDSLIHHAKGFDYYDDFSMWDTYRAVHPLMTILEPTKTSHMVQSLLLKAEQGGWMPIFPAWNNYTSAMIGDHSAAMIADAYTKGITGFDVDTAWKYLSKNAFTVNDDLTSYKQGKGRRALESYLKYHYLPMEEKVPDSFHKQEQVSRTLEYAYDDFAVAKLAQGMGNIADAKRLFDRSMNWKNIFDPSTGYVRGRNADGSWFEPFDPNATRTPFITEGTPFQYTWYVPHDVYGLMEAMGGREKFTSQLDLLFDSGHYWHGNEPGHQIPYLYAWAGKPWLIQQRVKQIIDEEYGTGPGGLSGNEDAGQMSAWLVFSMMGFYPVCPGSSDYILGTPAFETVNLNLENGKTFTIKANKVSNENYYIQSAALNGQPYEKSWISHETIVNGGELIFEMGPTPNEAWCNDPAACPPQVLLK